MHDDNSEKNAVYDHERDTIKQQVKQYDKVEKMFAVSKLKKKVGVWTYTVSVDRADTFADHWCACTVIIIMRLPQQLAVAMFIVIASYLIYDQKTTTQRYDKMAS